MRPLTIAYDARPLQPQTRHWGPGVVVENILGRLSGEFEFVGVAHEFTSPRGLWIKKWPAIRKTGSLAFEGSPLIAGPFDLYWGTNHLLPRMLRGPSVATVHDLLFVNRVETENGLRAKWLEGRFVSSARRATKIIADSKTTANELLSRFPYLGKKTEVGLLGFDFPALPHNNAPSSISYLEEPYAIMLGCHRPRKNAGLAVAVVKEACKSGAKVCLCITGNVHPSFEPLIRANSSVVRPLGVLPKEDVFVWLQGAAALLFPSLYEGFGFPLLEAMAAGCPVLALDTPINREIGGSGAWLLNDSPKEWAEAIKTLLGSTQARTELQERGYENLNRFSWDKTAALYGQVFREIAR